MVMHSISTTFSMYLCIEEDPYGKEEQINYTIIKTLETKVPLLPFQPKRLVTHKRKTQKKLSLIFFF